MIKTALFLSSAEPVAVPLFTSADSYFEKTASVTLLPEVVTYIAGLQPVNDAQYVLVNAMGAGEYWGANINGDHFPESALIHRPDNWAGDPVVDRIRSRDWPYGFPTFYNAHPFCHHKNKDPRAALGEVELAAWHDRMKRVELVIRIDRVKCAQFGGVGVWDKIQQGGFPDVSMGTKVPFDFCSICGDWSAFHSAMQTFDPKRHRSPGDAILEVHKRLLAKTGKGIRGLSITRKDYCEHALKQMNHILPDGRKVYVYNHFPKFFDISFVFIGADKTAKQMLKIAEYGKHVYQVNWAGPSAEVAEKLGYVDEDEKIAAVLGKTAKFKRSEISKHTLPSQFAAKAVPLLTKDEPSIPDSILDMLGKRSVPDVLATTSASGIVLRPREFQRIVLVNAGKRDEADALDAQGVVFPKVEGSTPVGFGAFSDLISSLLAPLLALRSSFGPIIERRVILISSKSSPESVKKASSLSSTLLGKIASAYNGYRSGLMEHVAQAQELMSDSGLVDSDLSKLAQVPSDELFTSLSVSYLKLAFWDEVGTTQANVVAGVERGSPSENTRVRQTIFGGSPS